MKNSKKSSATSPTEFELRVYELCKHIPRGKVSTYGEMAKKLKTSPRAVGNALNKNPFAPAVPCHRVIMSDGSLGGFATGVRKKANLLRKENIQFRKKMDKKYIIKS